MLRVHCLLVESPQLHWFKLCLRPRQLCAISGMLREQVCPRERRASRYVPGKWKGKEDLTTLVLSTLLWSFLSHLQVATFQDRGRGWGLVCQLPARLCGLSGGSSPWVAGGLTYDTAGPISCLLAPTSERQNISQPRSRLTYVKVTLGALRFLLQSTGQPFPGHCNGIWPPEPQLCPFSESDYSMAVPSGLAGAQSPPPLRSASYSRFHFNESLLLHCYF